jgi:RNA polymerase sigma-70 factor (ECF subfamily)
VEVVTDQTSDGALVGRSLSGDDRAFAMLVERHQARVFNVCLRMLGDAEDAADAAQEAFFSAFRKLGQFRGDAAFTTWLHRITVNACYDILRKRRRQPLLRSLPDDDGPLPEIGEPMPDHADDVAATMDVIASLGAVAEEFRVTLVLADVEDLPYEEIARILDIPVGTVKSRVHRGRLALARATGISAGEPASPSQPSEGQA